MNAKQAGLVLIVDDDLWSARGLARLLRADGFHVELAFHGAAAVARLARAPRVDVLITELVMPYIDGVALVEYARSRNPEITAVVATGYSQLLDGVTVEPRPYVHTKPIDYSALRAQLLEDHDERTRSDGSFAGRRHHVDVRPSRQAG